MSLAQRPSNPTSTIDVSFNSYSAVRQKQVGQHMPGGIPDYSFPLDYEIRRQINALPGVFRLFKAITNTMVPIERQILNMDGVAVGPNQYPEIYAMGEECARRLGIGVPRIFIKYDVMMNAYAYAIEDAEPLICLTSALVQHLSPSEVKYVIGHECGHIHNNHGIYQIAADIILGTVTSGISVVIPSLAQIMQLLTVGARLMFANWSRAAEVTCDRAGLICADNPEDAVRALAKIGFGGESALAGMDIDAYIRQIDITQATPARLLEVSYSHPLTQKRILAAKLFQECSLFYAWRPELLRSDLQLFDKDDIDKRCESFISVASNKIKTR